jgi:hypothetical protein
MRSRASVRPRRLRLVRGGHRSDMTASGVDEQRGPAQVEVPTVRRRRPRVGRDRPCPIAAAAGLAPKGRRRRCFAQRPSVRGLRIALLPLGDRAAQATSAVAAGQLGLRGRRSARSIVAVAKEVLLLTAPPGSGKTTTARLIAIAATSGLTSRRTRSFTSSVAATSSPRCQSRMHRT